MPKATDLLIDSYERKARLYPALLLLSPVLFTVLAFFQPSKSSLESLIAALVAVGGAFLLSQLARDSGKKREAQLWAQWGGMPSIAIFRHRDKRLDPITKMRYHQTMTLLLPGASAPTREQEAADPIAADHVFEAWSHFIRTTTRDTAKYALLFQENVSYGFRRNLYGLRPFGIPVSTLCLLISGGRVYQVFSATGSADYPTLGSAAFSIAMLALWLFRFSSDWVRIPADAYASRLAEAVETLKAKPL